MIQLFFLRLRALRAFLGLVRDPTQTDLVFKLDGAFRKTYSNEQIRELIPALSQPDFLKLHADRSNPRLDLEQLRKMPERSFGRAVANFLDQRGFNANEFPMVGMEDPVDFLISRMRQSHDLWHVLGEYETNVEDELALQAFTFAQLRAPLSPLIVAAGLVHIIANRPTDAIAAFEGIVEGWNRGNQCKSLVAFRWENEWETDLETIRQRLELPPRSIQSTSAKKSFIAVQERRSAEAL